MIIIKTNNGDRFINEAETIQVSHNKDKAEVEVWPSKWANQPHQLQNFIIEHVEAVIYTNVDHTVKYEDQSKYILSMYDEYIGMKNEIARLRAKLRDYGCEL